MPPRPSPPGMHAGAGKGATALVVKRGVTVVSAAQMSRKISICAPTELSRSASSS